MNANGLAIGLGTSEYRASGGMKRKTGMCLVAGAVILAGGSEARALNLVFDYSLDTNGFFNDPARRAALELAGQSFSFITDSLLAIVPGPSGQGYDNTWEARITHPGTGESDYRIRDLVVPADTLIIFAGGRNLSGSTLGSGGAGGFSSSGTSTWLSTVRERGQGSRTTDFGPWGGQVTFDTNSSWNFSLGSPPESGVNDFLSVAIHELTHLFGFSGGTQSFSAHVSGSTFRGPQAVEVYGGNVPYSSSHWGNGVQSVIAGTGIEQEAAMDPTLTVGARKLLTDLDYAALQDVGWEIQTQIIRSGDVDGSGVLDAFDVAIFEAALADASSFVSPFPGATLNLLADLNGSGMFDAFDVATFEQRIAGATSGVIPAPGTVGLLLVPAAGLLGRRSRRGF